MERTVLPEVLFGVVFGYMTLCERHYLQTGDEGVLAEGWSSAHYGWVKQCFVRGLVSAQRMCHRAAQEGDAPTVARLMAQVDEAAIAGTAAKHDKCEVLKLLGEHGVFAAVAHGRCDALRWALQQAWCEPLEKSIAVAAVRNAQLSVLQVLFDHRPFMLSTLEIFIGAVFMRDPVEIPFSRWVLDNIIEPSDVEIWVCSGRHDADWVAQHMGGSQRADFVQRNVLRSVGLMQELELQPTQRMLWRTSKLDVLRWLEPRLKNIDWSRVMRKVLKRNAASETFEYIESKLPPDFEWQGPHVRAVLACKGDACVLRLCEKYQKVCLDGLCGIAGSALMRKLDRTTHECGVSDSYEDNTIERWIGMARHRSAPPAARLVGELVFGIASRCDAEEYLDMCAQCANPAWLEKLLRRRDLRRSYSELLANAILEKQWHVVEWMCRTGFVREALRHCKVPRRQAVLELDALPKPTHIDTMLKKCYPNRLALAMCCWK